MELDLETMDPAVKAQVIEHGDLVWHDPRQGNFEFSGFHYIKKNGLYERLPREGTEHLREYVRQLARCTTGGQIRFRSDSCRIVLYLQKMDFRKSYTGETNQKDFDLYVGPRGKEQYWGSISSGGKSSYAGGLFKVKEKKMREFLINFPVYCGIEDLKIGLEAGSVIEQVPPRKETRPVVIYGTSITQGGFTSRPGLAFTNILSRRLEREFLNFAFSGNGQNDPEVAEILAEIPDPAMFIVDSQGNCITPEMAQKRLPQFVKILRKAHPEVPIVIMTEIKVGICRKEIDGCQKRKKDFIKVYQDLKKAGDKHLYLIEGDKLWGKDFHECTIDGVHPNDLGFYTMAQNLEKPLKKLLRKYKR